MTPEFGNFQVDAETVYAVSCTMEEVRIKLGAHATLQDRIAYILGSECENLKNPAAPDRGRMHFFEARRAAEELIEATTEYARHVEETCADERLATEKCIDRMIEGCTLAESIDRLHRLNEGFERMRVRSFGENACAVFGEISDYNGTISENSRDVLRRKLEARIEKLYISDRELAEMSKTFRDCGVEIAVEQFGSGGVEVKAMSAAILYRMSRAGLLSDAFEKASMNEIMLGMSGCTDLLAVSNTIQDGQRAFKATQAIVAGILIAAAIALMWVLIESSCIGVLADVAAKPVVAKLFDSSIFTGLFSIGVGLGVLVSCAVGVLGCDAAGCAAAKKVMQSRSSANLANARGVDKAGIEPVRDSQPVVKLKDTPYGFAPHAPAASAEVVSCACAADEIDCDFAEA